MTTYKNPNDSLFEKYKTFYECLINDCLVTNGIAQLNTRQLTLEQQKEAQKSIDRYMSNCNVEKTVPPTPQYEPPTNYKFYIMKASHLVNGEQVLDYSELRILMGDYIYTKFHPFWVDEKEYEEPWRQIIFEEWFESSKENIVTKTIFKYERSSNTLWYADSNNAWIKHPMGKHYEQLVYYLSDYEGTFLTTD